MGSVRSVVDGEVMVRKIQFPRLVIPLSCVLLALFNLCLNLIVVLIFALIRAFGRCSLARAAADRRTAGRALPPVWRCCCRALFVYLRDIQPIWEVLLQVLFYCVRDHDPDRRGPGAPEPLARPALHAESARDDLPAVQACVHHAQHPERGRAARLG